MLKQLYLFNDIFSTIMKLSKQNQHFKIFALQRLDFNIEIINQTTKTNFFIKAT